MQGYVARSQLPLQSSSGRHSPAESPDSTDGGLRPKNGAHRASTILVVEDDILTRMAAADHLRDCGYRVLEAADAEEARTLLRASEPIEVVFSDVNMPGVDGIRLAQWIAKEFPDLKVVLTSGDLRNAAAAQIATHFLAKPYDLDTLGRLIKTLL
jgi:DNA-binding NtrC family response regulator